MSTPGSIKQAKNGTWGALVRPTKITLGAYLMDAWLPARRASLRPSTAATYEGIIRAYVMPNLGGAKLQEVDGAA